MDKYCLTNKQMELLIKLSNKMSYREIENSPTKFLSGSKLIDDLLILIFYGLIKQTSFSKKFIRTMRGNYVFYNNNDLVHLRTDLNNG